MMDSCNVNPLIEDINTNVVMDHSGAEDAPVETGLKADEGCSSLSLIISTSSSPSSSEEDEDLDEDHTSYNDVSDDVFSPERAEDDSQHLIPGSTRMVYSTCRSNPHHTVPLLTKLSPSSFSDSNVNCHVSGNISAGTLRPFPGPRETLRTLPTNPDAGGGHEPASGGRKVVRRVFTNTRERWRQQNVNGALRAQETGTHASARQKLSKNEILRLAIRYIDLLNKVLDFQQADEESHEEEEEVLQKGGLLSTQSNHTGQSREDSKFDTKTECWFSTSLNSREDNSDINHMNQCQSPHFCNSNPSSATCSKNSSMVYATSLGFCSVVDRDVKVSLDQRDKIPETYSNESNHKSTASRVHGHLTNMEKMVPTQDLHIHQQDYSHDKNINPSCQRVNVSSKHQSIGPKNSRLVSERNGKVKSKSSSKKCLSVDSKKDYQGLGVKHGVSRDRSKILVSRNKMQDSFPPLSEREKIRYK